MRIRVGDIVKVRLAQDPRSTYMGAVTSIAPPEKGVVWEADTDSRLRVGMRLAHHADDERVLVLPEDEILNVRGPDEWQLDHAATDFVRGQHASLLRIIEAHYGTLEAPWSAKT